MISILLIEDDLDDAELLQDALTSNSVPYQMHLIKDGSIVASYLANCTSLPDIIVMDLNLPKVHGREIIKQIKQQEKFSSVPLVILTTSSSQDDIAYSYKEGATRHLTKPTTSEGFRDVVYSIQELAG